MLENEPSNGAEDAEGTTETETDTRPNGSAAVGASGEVRVTAPVRRGRAVSRPAGPPPEPDPEPSPAPKRTTVAAASVESVPAEAARAPEEPVAEAAEPELAAEAPAEPKKRTRRTAAKAATGTTRTRARRSSKAAEPEVAEPEPAAEPEVAVVVEEPAEEPRPESAATVTFQPPMVLFQPPVVFVPAVVEADAEDEDETEAVAEDEADASGDEADDDRPSRRRRRRGGRGRGKARTGDEQDEGGDEDAFGDAAEEPADAETAEQDESGGDDEAVATGSRRRRRRRRRSGGDSDGETAEPDDPPNTVVRVRPARAARAERPIEDEVQSVRGSTRLEAKRQRRREGREQGRRRPPIITESEFLARRESVKRDLVVRRTGERTQIAVLEDDVLVEHYVDRADHKSYVGNVYLGRVQNVLPSMEAAFVDIGKGRNAVLYAGEVNWDASGLEGQPRRIESALKSGQSVLVQVTKDPLGHKGARLTSQISLPGRYLVYVPDGSMTGISRKLPDKERARLKQILKKVMPAGAGVIVRTAAEGASEEELERDISRLAKQWDSIKRKSKSATAPALLNSEPDLTVRVVRDVFNEDFSGLVVSGGDAWDTVRDYVDHVAPHLAERLSHWDGERDVFEAYRIDEQIAKALDRKVWLPSGGSLVIDRTEAMTVIDVNTGKFTGQGGNLEETVTKNNLEAAEEIVRQLRLRDIGGIIVVDFIDMVLESNRDLVLRRMLECLSRDRTKHQVAEVTSLGLVQMTRKRVGQGLLEAFSHSCEHCNGRGLVLHTEPVEARANGNGNGAQSGGGRKKKNKGGADKADKVAPEPARSEPVEAEEGPVAPVAAPEPVAVPAEAEAKPARRTPRRAKRAAGPPPEPEDAAPAAGPAEPVAAAEPAEPVEADADQAAEADSAGERPRRRRTRRKAAPETAVAEAG
ncbi:Rne/Rng family ribonuclease [Actinorugispora endophytica]|uniref:Ribonuclease E n=1 Tax=Actinorugispora endophytica TaxID=1605990 RepID=A0A4V3D783_9ACTN|nr:Rne/Rng family ribonuclease [Actinorugispora endophytica]TDQ46867.1 ribonuclease E [Actinorugispora endophytica]